MITFRFAEALFITSFQSSPKFVFSIILSTTVYTELVSSMID